MKVLCFAPRYNIKKADATGAFQPEAKRFLDYHGADPLSLVLFDNQKSKPTMRKQVLDALEIYDDLDTVCFFCHGHKRGIQPGFDLSTIDMLAAAIAKATAMGCVIGKVHPVVCLYACDTARDIDADRLDDLEQFGGDGGFADELRDALCRAGATWNRVDGHTSAGHTVKNPNCRRFEGNGSSTGGIGGHYIVPFRSKMWRKWREALKGNFRYEFPFLTDGEIVARLEGMK